MNELDRERLKAALQEVRGDYKEEVERLGRERQEEFGADFSLGDFIAGACAIFSLTTDENGSLPWPATSWVWAIFAGRNPLWPGGEVPEPARWFREEWLVLDTDVAQRTRADALVVASLDDRFEAEALASELNEADERWSRFLVVRVPTRGYTDRENYPQLAAREEE